MVNNYHQSIGALHTYLNHVSRFSAISKYKSYFLYHRIFLAI